MSCSRRFGRRRRPSLWSCLLQAPCCLPSSLLRLLRLDLGHSRTLTTPWCVSHKSLSSPGVVPACLVRAARRTSAPVWQPTMGTSLCFPPRVETSRCAQPAPLHRPSSLWGGKALCVQSALAWLLAPLLCLCRSSSDRAQAPCRWLSVFPMPHQSLFRKFLDVALCFSVLLALTISWTPVARRWLVVVPGNSLACGLD